MMSNTNQDNKNNIPVHPTKDGQKWPISAQDYEDFEKDAKQLIGIHRDKSSLINNQDNAKSKASCRYLLLFMLMEPLSKDFIEKTIFNDYYMQLHPLAVLYSIAVVMGEDFALQFINRQFTSEDVYKAVTDKILAENAEQTKADEEADAAQRETIKELSDKAAETAKKINENEKTIQTIQVQHNNMIDFLNQEIAQVKAYYEELKTNNEKHSQEISNKNLEVVNAKVEAAEAKKDAEIKELQATIDYDKQIQEKDRKNYEEKIKAKDDEINSLKKQIDEYQKKLLEPNIEDESSNSDPAKKDVNVQNLNADANQSAPSLIDQKSLPKGRPDRRFSKKEANKRGAILNDSIKNRSNEQMEMIADAYVRGLPADALLQMYNWENASAANLRMLECALLRETYGLNF